MSNNGRLQELSYQIGNYVSDPTLKDDILMQFLDGLFGWKNPNIPKNLYIDPNYKFDTINQISMLNLPRVLSTKFLDKPSNIHTYERAFSFSNELNVSGPALLQLNKMKSRLNMSQLFVYSSCILTQLQLLRQLPAVDCRPKSYQSILKNQLETILNRFQLFWTQSYAPLVCVGIQFAVNNDNTILCNIIQPDHMDISTLFGEILTDCIPKRFSWTNQNTFFDLSLQRNDYDFDQPSEISLKYFIY